MKRLNDSIWVLACCLVAFHSIPAQAQNPSSSEGLWKDIELKTPWVFLGDSNTYSGGYIAMLDAWFQEAGWENRPQLINLGMSSETASGMSEVDHPFKRPCVHERLSKALAVTQPQVVFICYGMNDGIYEPANQANFEAYQRAMLELAKQIKATGAKLVCLTPPIFEVEPVAAKGKVGPTDSGRYAYFAPTADYDQVLEQQSRWCLENPMQADLVIDIHGLMHNVKQERLKDDPGFSFTKDGVHFGVEAHAIVAEAILLQLKAPRGLIDAYPSTAVLSRSTRVMKLRRDAFLSAVGKNRPGLPAGFPVWYAEQRIESILAEETPDEGEASSQP